MSRYVATRIQHPSALDADYTRHKMLLYGLSDSCDALLLDNSM
jgi:hypothetical protein